MSDMGFIIEIDKKALKRGEILVKVEAQGYVGPQCIGELDVITEALDGEVLDQWEHEELHQGEAEAGTHLPAKT